MWWIPRGFCILESKSLKVSCNGLGLEDFLTFGCWILLWPWLRLALGLVLKRLITLISLHPVVDNMKLVSGWLLFNTKRTIFHLCYDKNKLHFDEMMMPAFFYTNTPSLIFKVLANWNKSHRVNYVAPIRIHYSDFMATGLWSYSLVLLIVFGLTRKGLELRSTGLTIVLC